MKMHGLTNPKLVFIFHVIRHTLQMPNLNSIPSQDDAKQCFYNFYNSFKPVLVNM